MPQNLSIRNRKLKTQIASLGEHYGLSGNAVQHAALMQIQQTFYHNQNYDPPVQSPEGDIVAAAVSYLAKVGLNEEMVREAKSYDRRVTSSVPINALQKNIQSAAGAGGKMRQNRTQIVKYSNTLIVAFEEVLSFDPIKHHNSQQPALWIDNEKYRQDVRELLVELRKLNSLLEKSRTKSAKAPATKLSKHFEKFLSSYASTLGKGAAALTIATIAGLLYHSGVGPKGVDYIWGYLKLPK